MAFAVALGCVLREDARLVSRAPLDLLSLRATSRIVAAALAMLWATGFGIIMLDTGGSFSAIASNAKLAAKIVIVCALTLNGLALHLIGFPLLRDPPPTVGIAAHVSAALGAISAVSWAFATLLGISREAAKAMSFGSLILAYGLSLVGAVCAAMVFVAPVLRRKLRDRVAQTYPAPAQHLPAR